ncbi:MAG: ABC transporter permease [candidate division Zixibacteria bacterium]|nr:ABC transporter permease [candidate division Zixibacteria bacterium]
MNTTHPVTATTSAANLAREREPLPISRILRAYLKEAKFETIGALRTTGFAIPFIVVPLAIYLLFGVVINGNAGSNSEYGPGIADYLFSGFSVIAVVMPGIFSGVILATERDGNLLKLKRSLPQPAGATIVAKVLMSMGVAAIAVTLVVIAALIAAKITISFAQVAIIWAVLIVGTIPFCAMGLLIGTLSSGSAAPAYGNLVFLPMMWLSGLFIPLPDSLERWVVIWPAFHLNQLALGLAGVKQFSFIPPAIAGAVLVGVTVLIGGLAIRRLARVG